MATAHNCWYGAKVQPTTSAHTDQTSQDLTITKPSIQEISASMTQCMRQVSAIKNTEREDYNAKDTEPQSEKMLCEFLVQWSNGLINPSAISELLCARWSCMLLVSAKLSRAQRADNITPARFPKGLLVLHMSTYSPKLATLSNDTSFIQSDWNSLPCEKSLFLFWNTHLQH